MSADEQRIREFAYQIWQSEGCPEGQDVRHWEMACKLVEAERSVLTEIPAAKPKAAPRTRKAKAADEAEVAPVVSAPEPVPLNEAAAEADTAEQLPGPVAALSTPAKPRASRTRASKAAPQAATDAAAGTPQTIKKPRAVRTKKSET